jgi:hypothetical protein
MVVGTSRCEFGHPGGDSMKPVPLSELSDVFRMKAVFLRENASAEQAATAFEKAAEELEASLYAHRNESLTLKAAANESGYSESHLARMIRDGKLHNAGRKHAPRVLRKDLRTKLALSPPQPVSDLSNEQIVRSVTKLGEG